MRALKSLVVFLIGIGIPSCSVGPAVTPVTNPTERLQFQGLSILPPKGENWVMATSQRSAVEPAWTWVVQFAKLPKEKPARPAEARSIYVGVKTTSLGDVKVGDRIELLQHLARIGSGKGEMTTPPGGTRQASRLKDLPDKVFRMGLCEI